MEIRLARAEDIPRIMALLIQVCNVHALARPDLFQKDRTKYKEEELEALLQDANRPIFAAVHEGVLVGYCFCMHQQYDGKGVMSDVKTLYIDDLCVDEAYRGMHVGKALYEYVKAYAREQGYFNLTLNVWEGNDGAKAFYEHLGFRVQKYGMEELL